MISGTTDVVEMPIYTVAKCLNELIVNQNQDKAFQQIVRWLSDSLAIDRCFVISHAENNSSVPAIGISSSLIYRHDIDLQKFPEVFETLQSGRTYKVSTNNQVSDNIHQLLQQLQLQSILFIPVFRSKKLFGAIVFGDSQFSRTWRNSEMELHSLATAMGAIILAAQSKNESGKKEEADGLASTRITEYTWHADLIHDNLQFKNGNFPINHFANKDENPGIGNWVNNYVHPHDKKRIIEKLNDLIDRKISTTEEDVCRVLHPGTGRYFWMLSRFTLRKNAAGEPISILGNSIDITDTREIANAFKDKQEQFEFLVQSLSIVIFTLDCDGKCSFVSNAWKQMLGHDCKSAIGEPFIQFIASDHIYDFWVNFGKLTSGKVNSIDEKIRMVQADGSIFWVRWMAKSTRDAGNRITGIYGTIENIDQRYEDEVLRNDANDKLTTILNNSKEIILTINLQKNTIENVNDAIGLLGYRPDEWIGKNYKLWNDNQRQKFYELMKLAIQSELKVQNQQIEIANKSGTELITFEFSTSIFYYKKERYLLCVLRDIRERLKYEESINRISNQLNHLINSIDDVYAIYDLENQSYDFVSDNVEKMYGVNKNDYTTNHQYWKSIIHPEDLERVDKEIEAILTSKGRCEIFYRISTPSGEIKMILEKVIVSCNDEGDITKLYIIKTDYTHIEKAEQSLLDTERKFTFISENISDFISIHDPDWNFVYASPSINHILGYEPAEILGKGGFDLVHPDDLLQTLDDALEPIVLEKKETKFRYRMMAKDGHYKWVETYAKPVVDVNGLTSSIISSTRDVTDQVIAQNKLKVSEEKYRLLSENSNDIIAIHTLKGEYLYISPSCRQLLGYEPNLLIGKTPGQVFADTGGIFESNLQTLLQTRLPQKFIKKVKTATGEKRSLEIYMQPIFKAGELVSVQSASRDVTEREALLHELELGLAKEKELNELRSMFVSTASHQFRTPLTIIQSGVELMDMYIDELSPEKQKKFKKQFNSIHDEIERLEFLMNDVLLLGRANAARTPFNPSKQDMVLFCSNTVESRFNSRYPPERKVLFSVSGKPVQVYFDHKLIGHVIENVLGNAYKYSTMGNPVFNIHFQKDEVEISISDQGIGIPDEELKNLFQPFYRAGNTEEIEGTGLGLAIVKEFVEKHKGKINILSKLNKGTTVNVILPISL